MTLINNQEKELEHIANIPMKFEEILSKLRFSGLYISPTEQDVEYIGLKVKVSK